MTASSARAPIPTLSPGAEPADVTLLLEGTYPYVRGGVSGWVHQIISGTPERTFSLVFLGGSRSHYGEMRYELPPNVVHLESHYLMDTPPTSVARTRRRPKSEAIRDSARLHEHFRERSDAPTELLSRVMGALGTVEGIERDDFLRSRLAWEEVCRRYERFSREPSFVDYFWTVRNMHEPLFVLARVARTAPPGRLLHSISTGYAGTLGALKSQLDGTPFLLSEHGIYTKERKIDLAQVDWLSGGRPDRATGMEGEMGYIRQLWIRFFEGLGRLAYAVADPIVALYEGNRQRQILDGAPRERTQVIPNGIDLRRFASLRTRRPDTVPPVLGLIGRVVPIKDIKTFIRAMRTVVTRMPDAEGWIVGPEDEDEAYARECRELVTSLGLDGRVKFLGFQKVEDILPQLGLLVLSSISEAQPLSVLEGFAAGLPCVVTDVGCCRELVDGNELDDREIGSAGSVVPIASPEAMAQGALELLGNSRRWRDAQRAATRRVERYYTQELMLRRYRELYAENLEAAWQE